MPRVAPVWDGARRAIKDFDLLKILESELNHELSSTRYHGVKTGTFGEFMLEWDSANSVDVVLRKKCSSGEEVAVSALLGHNFQGSGSLPREALLKICIKKPSLSSILLFDCVASNRGSGEVAFDIQKVNCLPSSSFLGSLIYTGPAFSVLNPCLQDELRSYLVTRGIEENFTNSLLRHLHKEEQDQYMSWLQKLKDLMIDTRDAHGVE